MKLINTITTKNNNRYKVYADIRGSDTIYYYVKWKKYLLWVIPYFSFVNINYCTIPNERLRFYSIANILKWILSIEEIYNTLQSINDINQVS